MANPAFVNRGGVKMVMEAEYGTAVTVQTNAIYRSWNATMENMVAEIVTNNLRKGLMPEVNDKVAGLKSGTVQISGQLQLADVMLLKQIFLSSGLDGTVGKEYKIQEVQAAIAASTYSSTIYKLLPDSGATKYDQAVSAVMESLVITGATGGNITFTATYRCQGVNSNATVSLTGDAPTIATGCVPFTTSITSDEQDTIDSFTLTITNLFADDSTAYQNSQEKLLDAVIGTTVSLQTQSLRAAATVDSTILSETPTEITLVIEDADENTWTIDLYGKYTGVQYPHSENNIINATYNFEAMGDDSNPAIEITVA